MEICERVDKHHERSGLLYLYLYAFSPLNYAKRELVES